MTSKIPLISVLIPVYNVEKYLRSCIDSLINQTLDNIEFIFVDDLSTDNSLAILREYETKYPEIIKVISLNKKGYLGGARNEALNVARAEYIGFCDSDDIAHPQLFEKLYKRAKETDADWTVAQYAAIPQDSPIDSINLKLLKPWVNWNKYILRWDGRDLDIEGKSDVIAFEKGGLPVSLLKKEIIISNDLSWPSFKYEDNYFMSLYSVYVKRIAFVPEILYFYRQRADSTMHKRNERYHIDDRVEVERALLDEVIKRDCFEPFVEAWEFIYIYRYAVNTALIAIDLFDSVPVGLIADLYNDLKGKFPKWRQNKYWKVTKSYKERIIYNLLLSFPKATARFLKLLKNR